MVFVPVNNTVEVVIKHLQADEEAVNTVYFKRAAEWSAATLQGLADAIQSWHNTSVRPLQGFDTTLQTLHLRDLTTENGIVHDETPGIIVPGGVQEDSAANNVTMAVSFRTGLAGRSFRGRNFIVGLPKSHVVDNRVSAGNRGAWLVAYAELLTLGGAFGANWVVVSRYSGKDSQGKPLPRAAGIATTITSVIFVDDVVDSQRRRLPKRGR